MEGRRLGHRWLTLASSGHCLLSCEVQVAGADAAGLADVFRQDGPAVTDGHWGLLFHKHRWCKDDKDLTLAIAETKAKQRTPKMENACLLWPWAVLAPMVPKSCVCGFSQAATAWPGSWPPGARGQPGWRKCPMAARCSRREPGREPEEQSGRGSRSRGCALGCFGQPPSQVGTPRE